MGISVGIKTKKEALRKLGKPYLMLFQHPSPLHFKARDKKIH